MSARSHLLLESEARQLFCPLLQSRLGSSVVHCVGRECMGWREIDASSSRSGEREVVGYCAFMSTPPQVSESFTASTMASVMHAIGLTKADS